MHRDCQLRSGGKYEVEVSVERTVLYLSDVGSARSMSLLLIFLAHVKGEEKLACAKPQGPVRFRPVPLWSDSVTTHRN